MRMQASSTAETGGQATIRGRIVGCFGRSPRLTLSVALAALFILVPATQAFAEEGHVKLNIVGTGSGEVKSEEEPLFEFKPGIPPIACTYDGTSQQGQCENVPDLLSGEAGFYVELLKASPAPGSEFVGWTVDKGYDPGECEPNSYFGPTGCLVSNEEEGVGVGWEITADFKFAAPSSFKLELSSTGTGSGTFMCRELPSVSDEACKSEYGAGQEVEVIADPAAGSEFIKWTGDCTGSGPCVLPMTADHSVDGVFNKEAAHPAVLSVFKSGGGAGTVLSSPAGISCGSEPCEATLEQGDVITLEAHATTGSVFAGWVGCRAVAGEVSKCHVTLGSATVEVTAVFLTEGQKGASGETPTVSEFDGSHEPGSHPCGGRGGVQISTATATKYVCDGTIGKDGERGEIGFPGPEGPQGPAGTAGGQGNQGAQGAQGLQGPLGPLGPQGSQGKQGPAGPAGKVTCRVQQQKGAKTTKVTCTVKYQGATASASSAMVHWSLSRQGHTVRRGTAHHGRLGLGYLKRGHYRLHIQGQTGSRLIVVG